MKFLSVCSGIEAASVSWAPLGWKAWAFSEIESFPCSLLAHHYPDVPNLGDMTKFQDWPIPDEPIDLLCGGTPCQSFSVAGLRKGLADPRGNLMFTYLAIADKYRPRWLVWENVPGVLSSNDGRDFGAFLGGLGQLGYGFAYRVLDAQYFGVAQRRRRVFVVGHLGDWRRAAAVLFERHSLQGHPAPRRETRQGVAGTLSARTQGGGGLGTDFELGGGLIAETLRRHPFPGSYNIGATVAVPAIVGQAMSAKWAKGTAGPAWPAGDEHHNLIAVPDVTHALRGEGFDATEDGTGRGTPLVLGFQSKASACNSMNPSDLMPTMDKGKSDGLAIAFDPTQITSATNRSNPQPGDPCHTLTKGAHAPAIAIQGVTIHGTDKTASVASFTETAGALRARPPGSIENSSTTAVMQAMQVRRLTPEECEALQGFPRSYTAIPHRGKPAADGPRYKALGNSWAVPCARWIGERVAAVDSLSAHAAKEAA